MNLPTDQNSFLQFLQDEQDKMQNVRFEVIKDIGDKKILNISQRRDFFQHITTLALGIASITFFTEKIIHKEYFFIGLFFLIGTVIFILFLTREILDKDSIELTALGDRYNIIADEKVDLIEKFAVKDFSEDILEQYLISVQSLKGTEILDTDIQKESQKRENRHKQDLDYSGEIIVCLFLLGIFFFILSVLAFTLDSYYIAGIIILILILSFNDFLIATVAFISKVIPRMKSLIRKLLF